jgi:antitoxin YefM
MVEAPGTAPGSETLMSRGVYRHSRLPDSTNIGGPIGFLKPSRLYEFRIAPYIRAMDTVSYSRARQDLDRLMDKVSEDRAPLIVKRPGKRPVVVIDLEEYRGMEETIYLMRSPANARRLLKSIRSLDGGKGIERDLIGPRAKPRGSRRTRK